MVVEEPDGERAVRYDDAREVWEAAGVPEHTLETYFPAPQERGRPRLHASLDPGVLDDVVSRVAGALAHLEELPTGELEGHFSAVYGEPWPPHLREVHEVLQGKWRRGGRDLSPSRREYERQGTALRVAMVLPLNGWASLNVETGEVESVSYQPCRFSHDQLRPILDRA